MAKDKKRVIKDTEDIIKLLTDTSQLDSEITKLDNELEIVTKLAKKLVKENSKTRISFNDYNKKYEELQIKRDDLINTKVTKESQALKMRTYLNNINQSKDELDQWNESIWMLMVESAVVHRDSSITFKHRNNEEVVIR